jgi:hypothetical protein
LDHSCRKLHKHIISSKRKKKEVPANNIHCYLVLLTSAPCQIMQIVFEWIWAFAKSLTTMCLLSKNSEINMLASTSFMWVSYPCLTWKASKGKFCQFHTKQGTLCKFKQKRTWQHTQKEQSHDRTQKKRKDMTKQIPQGNEPFAIFVSMGRRLEGNETI